MNKKINLMDFLESNGFESHCYENQDGKPVFMRKIFPVSGFLELCAFWSEEGVDGPLLPDAVVIEYHEPTQLLQVCPIGDISLDSFSKVDFNDAVEIPSDIVRSISLSGVQGLLDVCYSQLNGG